ncbi:hypothetical protein PG994_005443 [Apiospora phragmitis]|uniref:Uncharacterized protein n=1 Tax=Apiospora phragmitis TaxID=2905665 RepID=A0ABR1VD97_9PEZI
MSPGIGLILTSTRSGSRANPDAEGAVPCCEATHTCLSNKLCWDTEQNHILRGGCTDRAFKDPACPHLCEGDAQGGGLAYLRQCNGRFDEWTCTDNLDVTNCAVPFAVDPGVVEDYRAGNVSNVIYANANTTRRAAGPESMPPANRDDDVQQIKLQVGLGAGLGVGLPLLIALAVSLWFLRRAQQELRQLKGDQPSSSDKAASAGTHHGVEQANNRHWGPTPANTGEASSSLRPVYPPSQYAQASSQQQQPVLVSYQPLYQPSSPKQTMLSPQEMEGGGQMLRQEADSSTAQPPVSAVQTPARLYAKPAQPYLRGGS